MMAFLNPASALQLWALIVKEFRHIKRNRRLIVSLIIPPTAQIIISGLALNAQVADLRMGVLDESRTYESREVISAFNESKAFRVVAYPASSEDLDHALRAGELDLALVVPEDFARHRLRKEPAEIQLLVDAVNSNTAAIASGYAASIIRSLNAQSGPLQAAPIIRQSPNLVGSDGGPIRRPQPASAFRLEAAPELRARVGTRAAFFFNPGLEHAWFIITGILGTLVILNGSIVASASIIKERESGTIEQLLMTPASAAQVMIAKLVPVFVLLLGQMALSLSLGILMFDIPFRGGLILLLVAASLCLLTGLGMGITIAAVTHSQQQAQLLSFFLHPPITILSGSITPIEAIPRWLQPITYFNPVRHFAIIARGVLIKGAGLSELYPSLLVLLAITSLLLAVAIGQGLRLVEVVWTGSFNSAAPPVLSDFNRAQMRRSSPSAQKS
jgi:ABC-2 type transport system permease protein